MNTQRTRRRFTKEFKNDAVGLVIDQGYSCAEVGRRLGVSENNVNRWVRQYRDKNETVSADGLSRKQMLMFILFLFIGITLYFVAKLIAKSDGPDSIEDSVFNPDQCP
jgi:hypothetical protein